MQPAQKRRILFALAMALVLAYEAYFILLKRAGESANLPPPRSTTLTAEIAGETSLEQSFVVHADGLHGIDLYPRRSQQEPDGYVTLVLESREYGQIARARVPAGDAVSGDRFTWGVPRIDQSAARSFTLKIAMPETKAGHGLRFEMGPPAYVQGRLFVGGREQWGDLKFGTRAARTRLYDAMRAHRRHASGLARSEAFWIAALVLFNLSIAGLLYGLVFAPPPSVARGLQPAGPAASHEPPAARPL
jgi:hypothetical protein